MNGRRPTAMGRVRDDAGAVAILVALSMSTFLVGFAALAIDFGQVYTRRGELQSVADLAALSAARELPDAAAAREKAVETVCSQANRVQGWDLSEVCPAGDPNPAWTGDADLANGHISFYGEDADGDGRYDTPEEITDPAGTDAVAIRILLPSTRVAFGLARTLGADGATVQEAATARIGTPLGMGMLPFAVTTADLSAEKQFRFCIKDPDAATPAPTAYPGPAPEPTRIWPRPPIFIPRAPTIKVTPEEMAWDAADRTITIVPDARATRVFPPDVTVFFGSPDAELPITRDGVTLQAEAPTSVTPGQSVLVWVEYTQPASIFGPQRLVRSYPETVTFTSPTGTTDPCARPEAERGYLKLDRTDASDPGDALAANISEGLDRTVQRWPQDPGALAALESALTLSGLGPTANGLQCTALQSVATGLGIEPLLANAPGGVDNCVEAHTRGFAQAMTTGFLGPDAGEGRLTRRCSAAQQPVRGTFQLDGTDLFKSPSPLVNEDAGLTPEGLRNRISSGGPPVPGAIDGKAFECPRLVTMPVIDTSTVNEGGQYPVVDVTYAWIEDDAEGLLWQDTDTLRAVRGYVVDPEYFPETVSGSPVVGTYLGDDLPKEAVLVLDRDDA